MSAELEDADLIVDLHGTSRTRVLTLRQKAPVLRAPSYRVRRSALVHARWARLAPPPTALARMSAALAPVGLMTQEVPRVTAGDEAEQWAAAWLASWAPGRAPVALMPGARHFTKRWPEAHWISLHEGLRAQGLPLLYLSLASERAALPALAERAAADPAVRWSTDSLARMAALLSRAGAAVSSDSGLMHLAAARGTRVVALFGSTAPELGFAPAGLGHRVLCRHEPCQPCTIHGRASCPKGHFRCMRELLPEAVLEATQALLAAPVGTTA